MGTAPKSVVVYLSDNHIQDLRRLRYEDHPGALLSNAYSLENCGGGDLNAFDIG